MHYTLFFFNHPECTVKIYKAGRKCDDPLIGERDVHEARGLHIQIKEIMYMIINFN